MGIHLEESELINITHCTISENREDGIFLEKSIFIKISNNNVSQNNKNGIIIQSSNNNSIENNYLSKNHEWGILIDFLSSGNSISSNSLIENIAGCYKDSGVSNIFRDNECPVP